MGMKTSYFGLFQMIVIFIKRQINNNNKLKLNKMKKLTELQKEKMRLYNHKYYQQKKQREQEEFNKWKITVQPIINNFHKKYQFLFEK